MWQGSWGALALILGLALGPLDARAAAEVKRSYRDLAESFTRDLQGRFPFVSGADSHDAEDVRPEALIALYRALDALRARQALASLCADAQAFVHALVQARPLLSAVFVGGPEAAAPPWSFSVEFGRDPHSPAARQLVAQSLRVGDGVLRYPNGADQGLWRPGESVSFLSTWAEQATWQPVAFADRRPPKIEHGRQAVFDYGGRAALLRMLWAHGAPSEENGRSAYTLRFAVLGQARGSEPATQQAVLQLGLNLHPPAPVRSAMPVLPQSAPPCP